MNERDELETLRNERRLAELEAKASGVGFSDLPELRPPLAKPQSLDPTVDYDNEVGDMGFRAAYSFMRTPRQKQVFLDKAFGAGNWGQDSVGTTIVHPAGLSRLGIQSEKSRPIDRITPTKADLADFASHIAPVAGGIGGSLAATGVGVIPGMAIAGGGAALGQALNEAGKAVAGYPPNAQEAAQAMLEEGLGGLAGEGSFRALRGLARTIANPASKAMNPEREALMNEALNRGFMPYPGQVTGSSLQQRVEGVTRRIFGTANEMTNIPRTIESLDRLKKMTGGAEATQEQIGQTIKSDIVDARKAFGEQMSKKYSEIDLNVPTSRLIKQAQNLLDSKVQTIDGKMIAIDPPTQSFLTDLTNLPPEISAAQMHELRSMLRNKGKIKNLAPTLGSMEFRLLGEAADSTFEHAATRFGNTPKIAQMRAIDAEYKEGISKFNIPFLGNITKDKSLAASVDPDQVLDYAIKNKMSVRAREMLDVLPENTKAMVRRNLADRLTAKVWKEADDPFSKIMSGTEFKASLDEVGADTLNTVMGKEWTVEAYKLADVIKMVTSGNKQSGGLVVANAILNPLNHLGALAAYKTLSQAMTHKSFLRWMTVGMARPQSVAGKAALRSMEETLRAMTQSGPAAIEEGISAITQ